MDQTRSFRHFEDRANDSKHRGIGLRHDHIVAGQSERFQKKSGNHQGIAKRSGDEVLFEKENPDTDNPYPPSHLLPDLFTGSRGREYSDIPSGIGKTTARMFQHSSGRSRIWGIDPIDEEDGRHLKRLKYEG